MTREERIKRLAEKCGRSMEGVMMFVERDGLEYCEEPAEGVLESMREFERGEYADYEETDKKLKAMIEKKRRAVTTVVDVQMERIVGYSLEVSGADTAESFRVDVADR